MLSVFALFVDWKSRGVTADADPRRGSADKNFTEVSEVIFLNSNNMVTLLSDDNKFVLRF